MNKQKKINCPTTNTYYTPISMLMNIINTIQINYLIIYLINVKI